MRKIATISVLVAPLLAGCASGSFSKRPADDALSVQGREIASVRSQLRNLKRRVGALKRDVARLPVTPTPTVDTARYSSQLKEVTSRVADVEAKLRTQEPDPTTPDISSVVANLSAQLAELSLKFERLKEQKSRDKADRVQLDQDAIKRSISSLEARLTELSTVSSVKNSQSDSNQDKLKALEERLAKLEGTNKAAGDAVKRISSEQEKDRVLVVDYLEDLDQRITELERSASKAPAPQTKPEQPTK